MGGRVALLCCDGEEAGSLALSLSHALSQHVAGRKQALRYRVALVRCEAHEANSLAVVLRQAIAQVVVLPELALRHRIARFRCLAQAAELVPRRRHPREGAQLVSAARPPAC
jgi:hypothetical protein